MTGLEERLAKIERRLNSTGLGQMRVVVISGGIPGCAEPLFAVAGQHEWIRFPTEGLDEFCDRVTAAAREVRCRLVTIGGLPASPAQEAIARAAFDVWLASGADDVPPEEAPGYVPRRSRYG